MDTPEVKRVRVDIDQKTRADHIRRHRKNELYNSSDRVCAVVWGATIHDLLKTMVRDKLIKNGEYASHLFAGEGPLANFAVLHDLAHAIGLIGDAMRNDICCVRQIRNEFAHNITVVTSLGKTKRLSFSRDKVASHCANLKCPELVPRSSVSLSVRLTCEKFGWDVSEKTSVPNTPRRRFQWTCECLAFILSTAIFGPKKKWGAGDIDFSHKPALAQLASDWCSSGSALDYPRE